MNIKTFYNGFKNVSLQHPLVSDAITGDIYVLNSEMHTYPLTCCGIENITRADNSSTYTCILYYADRVLENASNVEDIQSTAHTTLSQIINQLASSDLVLNYSKGTFTLFEQKFADMCAGAYVRCSFGVVDAVGECTDYIFVEPSARLQVRTVTMDTPTTLTVTPTAGYDGMSSVTVEPTFTDEYEVTSNKVQTISASSTTTQYPSAKAVYDTLGDYYTETETDTLLSAKANSTDVYTKTETDTLLNAKANKITVETATPGTTNTIVPNVFYDFGTLTDNLTLTLSNGTYASTDYREWAVQFNSGSGSKTISLPLTMPDGTAIEWQNIPSTITASKNYQLSIVNGCGLICEFNGTN